MTRIAVLRRRFDAFTTAFSGTLAAKIITLNHEQRLAYDQWCARTAAYCATYPGGEAYARMINGDELPPLGRDIERALFGASTGIPIDATDTEAGEIYRRSAVGD